VLLAIPGTLYSRLYQNFFGHYNSNVFLFD
jgi:hypothetical protein